MLFESNAFMLVQFTNFHVMYYAVNDVHMMQAFYNILYFV